MSVTGFNRKRRALAAEQARQDELEALTVKELQDLARERGLGNYGSMKKAELIAALEE